MLDLSAKSAKSTVSFKKYFPDGEYDGFIACRIPSEKSSFKIEWSIRNSCRNNKIVCREVFNSVNYRKRNSLYLYFPVKCRLPEPGMYEFLLKKTGDGVCRFDYFYLKAAGQNDPYMEIKPYDGIFVGKVINDSSKGKVVMADPCSYPPGPLVFAPNRFYEKGSYKAVFSLKGECLENIEGPVAVIQVTDSSGGRIFAEKLIYADNFNRDKWSTFYLLFNLEAGMVCNFHISYKGKCRLYAGKIKIIKEK